jgi:hypothetical protein
MTSLSTRFLGQPREMKPILGRAAEAVLEGEVGTGLILLGCVLGSLTVMNGDKTDKN